MLTVSDAGGAALFFSAVFILMYARDIVNPVTTPAINLRRAILMLAGSLFGIGLIYFGFGLAGIDVGDGIAAEGVGDPYAIGRAFRPWGKTIAGLFAFGFAVSVWRWDRATNPARKERKGD